MAAPDSPIAMTARRAGALSGPVEVPGDKSISHRALILGALAVGETRIAGLLEAEDVRATANALTGFGAEIAEEGPGSWSVHGVGVGGFAEPDAVVDCANSGTGARLLMGAMATSPITATFTGDASLRSRPMGRITEPLAGFGARAVGRSGGRLPLTLVGAGEPVPVDYEVPVPSAQVKSAVLLAGLAAPGRTRVRESVATRDHTERMLAGFGAEVAVADGEITVTGQPELAPQSLAVPRDPSAAAFPLAAAAMVSGSELRLPAVGTNPTRSGFLTTLNEMGADLEAEDDRLEGGEPVADLRIRHAAGLRGVDVPAARAPAMIDEYPALAVLAATAEGTTVMHGVAELRVKECDRLAALADGLAACGVAVEAGPDTLTVHGCGAAGVPGGARVESRHDHRIAMAFLCLGAAATAPVTVDDIRPVATSFPGFASLMRGLGADLRAGA